MFDFLDTGTYSDLIRLIALACWGLKQILFYLHENKQCSYYLLLTSAHCCAG